MMPILATWYVSLLALFFVAVAVLMMLIILVQKPKGGGLSGAFGGSGGGENAFMGAKAGDALTYATVVLFVLFLGASMGMVWLIRAERSGLQPTQSQAVPTTADEAAQSIQTETPSATDPAPAAPVTEEPAAQNDETAPTSDEAPTSDAP